MVIMTQYDRFVKSFLLSVIGEMSSDQFHDLVKLLLASGNRVLQHIEVMHASLLFDLDLDSSQL